MSKESHLFAKQKTEFLIVVRVYPKIYFPKGCQACIALEKCVASRVFKYTTCFVRPDVQSILSDAMHIYIVFRIDCK